MMTFEFTRQKLHRPVTSLHNNLAKPFSTVCTDPFYGQTSGPIPPKYSQADPKLVVKSRLPKNIEKKYFTIFFEIFEIFF
jgi:hypothetical protein